MTDRELVSMAEEAMSAAYAPYSGFKVGAALAAHNAKGEIRVFTGCNIENASYSPTICAERAAFHTRELADQIGSTRLSFGSADKMQELLNLTPGSVTIMGLMYDKAHKVTLLIDHDLTKNEYICFHPCQNTGSVKAKTEKMFGEFLKYTGHTPTYVTIKA